MTAPTEPEPGRSEPRRGPAPAPDSVASYQPQIHEAALDAIRAWAGWRSFEEILENRPGMPAFLAGGALRNVILDQAEQIKDFDIFTNERHLDEAAARLALQGRIEPTLFGSPRWFPRAAGGVYCDLMAIERFHNGLGLCENIVDVLWQFDFTANAVALDLRSGRLFDPVGGLRDIRDGVMRANRFDLPDEPFLPGQKLTRPQFLWLRIVHYSALLGLTIEPVTLEWLRRHGDYADAADHYAELLHPLHPEAMVVLERTRRG